MSQQAIEVQRAGWPEQRTQDAGEEVITRRNTILVFSSNVTKQLEVEESDSLSYVPH